ncbi:ATP-grasp domain-containing protein [Actinokineospora sp.]|uniref:preATP grasp domain-containing protein n=1 Tax=Actinokineospora sp. TaxID=1872133 RepID=UPI004037E530
MTAQPVMCDLGESAFGARLKQAVVGDRRARFVYLNNFEVERSWARGEPALPGARIAFATSTVNRMEEMGVLLADPGDIVVLKAPLDPGYADYLRGLGCAAGEVVVVDRNDPVRSVTEDALAAPRLLATLGALVDGRTHLMPLGIGVAEQELAVRTGLPLAGPSARVCKSVNGKIYSRGLVDAVGLRAIPGTVCETVDDLARALATYLPGGDRVVVKESLGVSGRGMIVLDGRRRAESLLRMLARRGQDARVDVVVETWIERGTDLNYQFLLSRTGEVRFATVKAAVVDRGVHKGHRFPVDLSAAVTDELHRAADLIGRVLFADGYFGMVGVDAILGPDGTLYPCLEINARLNMSSYASRLAERYIGPGRHAVAATLALRPSRTFTFAEVADALGDLLFDGSGDSGLLVNGFATLNAAAPEGGQDFPGRIYAIAIAGDDESAGLLRQRAQDRLQAMVGWPPC